MDGEVLRCKALKPDGERCGQTGGIVDRGSGLCLWHDPARREKAMKARRLGGKLSRTKARKYAIRTVLPEDAPPAPKTIEEAVAVASWAIHNVATGRIDARTAEVILKGIDTWRRAHADSMTAQELAALKGQLEELRGKPMRRLK